MPDLYLYNQQEPKKWSVRGKKAIKVEADHGIIRCVEFPIRIGGDQNNRDLDIVLADERVSGIHFIITAMFPLTKEASFYVQDALSSNGTTIISKEQNTFTLKKDPTGRRIQIADQDIIKIGRMVIGIRISN